MAFANITTFYYPTAANAGSSQWGSDVRKMLDSADAGNDATTVASIAALGSGTRTFDPYTAHSSDLTQADYGWAVTPSDMNSVAGARRFIKAGDHTLTARMKNNTSVGVTITLFLYIYRVGPAAARTRTLLGSNSASISLPALNAYTTATLAVTLGEVLFEEDETIQYSCEMSGSGGAVGISVFFDTGTQGGVAIRIDHEGLATLADGAATITNTSTVSGVTGKVLGASGSIANTGTVAALTSWTAAGVASVAAQNEVLGAMSSVAAFAGTMTGTCEVIGLPSIVLGTEFEIDTGGSGGSSTGYAKSRVVNA